MSNKEYQDFDYKDTETLERFLSQSGQIHGRQKTNLSAREQRSLTRAIKKARFLALLPYTHG